jgi:hypothetical protein
MNGDDLDNPLPTDDCDRCGAAHWSRCMCDPAHPRRQPTAKTDNAPGQRTKLEPKASHGGSP